MSDKTLKIIERLQKKLESVAQGWKDEHDAHEHTLELLEKATKENKILRRELAKYKEENEEDEPGLHGEDLPF